MLKLSTVNVFLTIKPKCEVDMEKRVKPLKSLSSINAIKDNIKNNPRDITLFTVGINSNIELSDLLKIKIKSVEDIEPGNYLEIVEEKSDAVRRVNLTKSCIDLINTLLFTMIPYSSEDYLFQNKNGGPITVQSVSKLIKKWCWEAGLTEVYSGSTLRKTWGYFQGKTYNIKIETLQICLNHSSSQETRDYLCLEKESKT